VSAVEWQGGVVCVWAAMRYVRLWACAPQVSQGRSTHGCCTGAWMMPWGPMHVPPARRSRWSGASRGAAPQRPHRHWARVGVPPRTTANASVQAGSALPNVCCWRWLGAPPPLPRSIYSALVFAFRGRRSTKPAPTRGVPRPRFAAGWASWWRSRRGGWPGAAPR